MPSEREGRLIGPHPAGTAPKLAPGIYGKPSDKAWTIVLDEKPEKKPR